MNTVIVKTNLKLIEIIKDIYTRSRDDDVPALAAQLTYYFILALFPFFNFSDYTFKLHTHNRGRGNEFFRPDTPATCFLTRYWTL